MSLPVPGSAGDALGVLSRFRVEFYACLYARADSLFELTDAILCKDGPVQTLVDLSLEAEHRRGHGALYQALNTGWAEPARLRSLLASLPVQRAVDGRIVLAVDISTWLRPDADALHPARHRQQTPHCGPLTVRHVRRIPPLPTGAVARIPETVREAVARLSEQVGLDRCEGVQQRQQGVHSTLVGLDTPELHRRPCLHVCPDRRSPDREPTLEPALTTFDSATASQLDV